MTPLALCEPACPAPLKYIVRSTTTSAGVVVSLASTALTRAEALPLRLKSPPRRTVRRALAGRSNVFDVPSGVSAPDCGSNVTVTLRALALGFPT